MSSPAAAFVPKPCPTCGRPSVQEAAPFCSRHCADVDLHRWFSGRYAIPAAAPPTSDPEDDRE